MNLRSIDSPRRRPAPTEARLERLNGECLTQTLSPRTLIVAVKDNCDGCRAFVEDPLAGLDEWELLLVSRDRVAGALREVYLAPALLAELEISSAPFFVALDGAPLHVVHEGVVFAPEQVANELSSH